jgi:hypothetical protein
VLPLVDIGSIAVIIGGSIMVISDMMRISWREGISKIEKINNCTPLQSNTVVKSTAQCRLNESNTERQLGGANRSLGGTKPLTRSIFSTVFFET